MNRRIFHFAAFLLLAACGRNAPVGVVNRLPVEIIIEVQTRIPGGTWSDNRLEASIPPGESGAFPAPQGRIELLATDNLGRTFTHRGDLTSEGIVWEVTEGATATGGNPWTGQCPVTVINDLGSWTITRVLCSPSDSSEWGESWISQPLQPGQSATFNVATGTYDIRLEDNDGDTYTRWEIGVTDSGYFWNATLEDLDSSGG